MLNELNKKNKKVLVCIDEATNNKYMQIFASSFQIFIRHKLPLFLVMTGLYENIKELKDEKNLTFLYRTPSIQLDPLSLKAIVTNYEETLKVDHETARKMANLTKGYSFAFQALGHEAWQQKNLMKK